MSCVLRFECKIGRARQQVAKPLCSRRTEEVAGVDGEGGLQRHGEVVGVDVLEIKGAGGLSNCRQVDIDGAIEQRNAWCGGDGDAVAQAAYVADQLRARPHQLDGDGFVVQPH